MEAQALAEEAVALARDLTRDVDEILPPRAVLEAFRALATAHPGLERHVLGHDTAGEPIEAYRWGQGSRATLWYAFPDPGEAVGGTGLLALARALVAGEPRLSEFDLSWWMIPCLNLLDQPEDGERLGVVQKTAAQEVDWCTHAPRPETTALLTLAAEARPFAVFPLHDEFHCAEPLPVYVMVSDTIAPDLAEAIRQAVTAFGYPIDDQFDDPRMGPGLCWMGHARDYAHSTFSVMGREGLVAVCEVSLMPGIAPRDMAAAQLAASWAVLKSRL